MVLLSQLKYFGNCICGGNRVRKAEKKLRNAALKMGNPYQQRIDQLRSASGMTREAFDAAVMDLIARQRVDLAQGDLTDRMALSDDEFMDLIEIDGTIYLYIVWPNAGQLTPPPMHPGLPMNSPSKVRWQNRTVPVPSEMAQWLNAIKKSEKILDKLGEDD